MRGALAWGFSLLGAAGLACTPMMPPSLDASGLAEPTTAAPDERPIPPGAGATPTPVPASEPPPIAPRDPIGTVGCPLKWTPAPLHASVLHLPAEIAGRFMIPLHEAACACTRPGDHLSLVARIVPERGEITITTATRAEQETRAEPNVDACFARVTRDRRFEAFELGSDVVCPDEPKPEPRRGPPFFRAPRRAGCQRPATSLIVYPLLVDRRNEG